MRVVVSARIRSRRAGRSREALPTVRPCDPRGLVEYGADVEELHAALRRVIIQDLLGCPGVPQNLCNDDAPWLWDCNGNGIPDRIERYGYNPADLTVGKKA